MKKPKSLSRELAEWALWIGIPLMLYFTGLHTEALGGVQRVFLATGLLTPKVLPEQKQIAAEYNLPLVSLDGKPANLSDFRGKVVFMNLWATWCPPCVAEMPGIQDLYEKIDTSKVAFVMISLDEKPEKARKFILRKKFTFPVYQLTGDIPDVYSTASIPTTFVLSPDGRIVVRKEGMAEYGDEKFVKFLHALAEKR
ncbi:MAG: TlpA disulfide reductase family protein [Bacteroidota bacterium]